MQYIRILKLIQSNNFLQISCEVSFFLSFLFSSDISFFPFHLHISVIYSAVHSLSLCFSLTLSLSYSISLSFSISLSLALFHFTLLFSHPYFLLLRVEFEAACEDLFARLTAPIDAALKMAGKTLADVQSVELLGERSRKTVS